MRSVTLLCRRQFLTKKANFFLVLREKPFQLKGGMRDAFCWMFRPGENA